MSERIRILLDDGMQVERGTGIGKYSEHLGRALEAVDGVSVDYARFEHSEDRKGARLAYLRHINSSAFRAEAEAHDLCIFTNYAMPFKRLSSATAVTVHDLAVFDRPGTLPRLYLPYGRAMIRNAVKRADAVVTVSETMSSDIRKRFPRVAGKVAWAWPGIYSHVRVGAEGAPFDNASLEGIAKHPFFLVVGTVEKRKNVEFVIRSFAKFKKSTSAEEDWKLVLAGRPGFGFEDIVRVAASSGCRDSVVFTGYVSDNDCANLYRDTRALVFPSVYEGFGSVQSECMAMGVSLILSDIPTNREVSEGYGVFFSLGDIDGLVSAMEGSGPLSETQKQAARLALSKANWASVADCYLDAFRGEDGR